MSQIIEYTGIYHDEPSLSVTKLGLSETLVTDEGTEQGQQQPSGPRGTAPRRLRGASWLSLGIQVSLTMVPILFIALGATAVSLHKKPTSSTGRAVQGAIKLSPTVFGIIFAAIIGKFFRALGLHGVERGIRLGTLERLMGSQSLFGAVERQLVLRGQWLLGLSMILLWALSPLGGQSALRLLQVSPRIASSNITIRYLPSAASTMTAMGGASGASSGWPSYAPLYMTALTTYRRQEDSTEDFFGNVKIPSLETMLASSQSVGNTSWQRVDDGQAVPYSSMLGIPIVGVPAVGNVSFHMTSRYYVVDCDTSGVIATTDIVVNDTSGTLAYDDGATFVIQVDDAFEPDLDTTFVSFNMSSPNTNSPEADVSFLACSVIPRDVESAVFCIDEVCRVTAMRNLTVDLSLWEFDQPNIQRALLFLPAATVGELHHGSKMVSSPTELWLQEPDDYLVAMALNQFSNLSTVPLPTLSRNFEILFNTYWQATYGAQYLSGNLSTTNMSAYDDLHTYAGSPVGFNTSRAASTRRTGEQYECDMTFAALLLAISCLLLVLGAATLALLRRNLAPDILGYVSSYTRDNPFATATATMTTTCGGEAGQPARVGSYLDGLESAKALQEMKIILGDVDGERETGYIALAAAAVARPLRRDRLYI